VWVVTHASSQIVGAWTALLQTWSFVWTSRHVATLEPVDGRAFSSLAATEHRPITLTLEVSRTHSTRTARRLLLTSEWGVWRDFPRTNYRRSSGECGDSWGDGGGVHFLTLPRSTLT